MYFYAVPLPKPPCEPSGSDSEPEEKTVAAPTSYTIDIAPLSACSSEKSPQASCAVVDADPEIVFHGRYHDGGSRCSMDGIIFLLCLARIRNLESRLYFYVP